MTKLSSSAALDVPFVPRVLPARERSDAELFVFASPKLRRQVMVKGPTALFCALELEFDATVTTYVERPRSFAVGQLAIECDFWLRSEEGAEMFLLAADMTQCQAIAGGRVKRIDQDKIDVAARAQSLRIEHRYERSYLHRSEEITAYLRLLPLVQASMRLVPRTAIRESIRQIFSISGSTSIDGCYAALPETSLERLSIVMAWMIHAGEVTWKRDEPLTSNTPLRWRARHAVQ